MFSRPALLGPVILIIGLAVGYPIYWFYAASIGEDLVTQWIEERRLQSIDISHGSIERSGFPLLVRIDVKSPEARSSEHRFQFTSQSLSFEFRPWNFKTLRVEANGAQQLKNISTKTDQNLVFNATGIESVLSFAESDQLSAISIVTNGLQVVNAARGSLLSTKQFLTDIEFPDRPPITHKELAFRVNVFLEGITLPEIEAPLLGNAIQKVRLKAEFLGPLTMDAFPQNLQAWRDAGGTLELPWLSFVWGALDMRANGTVALDQRMRPLGALTADIRGFEEALGALAEASILRREMLPASRVTLNLLAKTDNSDGRRVLTVPLTAQEGALLVGPIKLAALPPVVPTLR